jgi:three-Cys-motif partner protein
MPPKIQFLPSADDTEWNDELAASDGLPIRNSGSWIDTKHQLLAYYAKMFTSGMKGKFENRFYLELFSGPGRCLIRTTGKEELGSPLVVIGHEFTRFIFTEISVPAAQSLAARLDSYPNAHLAEIWCGNCADVVQRLVIPANALTFAFIDPTGIGNVPFSLIETLHRKAPRCDLLINIQHGMGIKMNIHQYTPDADEQSALTKFLGNDSWKSLSRHDPPTFFRGVLDIYKTQLDRLGFSFVGNEVLVRNDKNLPLYLLLYASKHPLGRQFWQKALKGVMPPELDFG